MALTNLSRRSPEHLPGDAYDVRGWEVRTEFDGESVGTVEDMLLDEQDHPRYLDVDLGMFRKHILVPLAEAHADPSEQVVWIDRLDSGRLEQIPEYDHDPEALTPEFEARLEEEYRLLAEDGRTGRAPRDAASLVRLGDMNDYRVTKGEADPRGWKLVGGDGQKLGKVEELIVDPAAMKTRYLDCSVEEDALGLEPVDRHVLIPAERATVSRKEKQVLVPDLFARDLRDYPVYQGLPLDGDAQRRIHRAYGPSEGPERAERGARRFFAARPRSLGGAGGGQATHRGRPGRTGDGSSVRQRFERREDEEVRIRITGGEIIIEKQGRERKDDG